VKGVSSVLFSSCKKFEEVPGFSCSRGYTSYIDLTQDLESIWHNMHRRSCRYRVKRAEREGVQAKKSENYDEFYKVYRPFLRSTKQTGFLEQLKTIRDYGTLFTAEHNNELLGGHVYLQDEHTFGFWIGANSRFETANAKKKTLMANASHLIHWEAIKYAKERGLAEYDFGGLFAEKGENYPGYSIDAFKKRFGGKPVVRYHYHKDYNIILALARKIYNVKHWRDVK
jgi:lipid II:glycine glycyltransferase (peptidoglycan interpeptide bridge formation enzyme)